MAEKIDWEKLADVRMLKLSKEEIIESGHPEFQPKWDIPPKVSIQCTISGGGVALHNANPNQPRNLDEISKSAMEVIEVGPTVVHFDHDLRACYTKDGQKVLVGQSYVDVVKPLLKKYGREKLLPHINCIRGDFRQQMLPVVTGLAELTYIHPMGSAEYVRTVVPIFREYGIRAEIVNHTNSELDVAQRLFVRSGLLPNPNLWILLPAVGARTNLPSEYMPNERSMCRRLISWVEDIKAVDPNAFITVCCSGRASTYLVTLALILGLNIRMGMEDTVWQHPHRDEMITNNADTLRWAIEMARMLGREVMKPSEFREAVGLKPRFGME